MRSSARSTHDLISESRCNRNCVAFHAVKLVVTSSSVSFTVAIVVRALFIYSACKYEMLEMYLLHASQLALSKTIPITLGCGNFTE